MTAKTTTCDVCKATSVNYTCDGCGVDVRGMEDAVRVDVYLGGGGGGAARAQLDYCHPCAVKLLPQAVGAGPGSDLPAVAPTKKTKTK